MLRKLNLGFLNLMWFSSSVFNFILCQSLSESIDLHIGIFSFHFVIIVLLLVILDILSWFSFGLIQLNVQILDLFGKLLFIWFPMLLVLLVPLLNLLKLVLLDFDCCVLVFLGCRQIEFDILRISEFLLELSLLFFNHFVLISL